MPMQQCSVRALALVAAFIGPAGMAASASAEIAPEDATAPPAAVATTTCPKVAEGSVIETLNRLYGAARSHDEPTLRAVLAADFHGLEGSERLSSDAMVADAAAEPAAAVVPGAGTTDPAGADAVAAPALREPDVHILCDSAWATFHTRGGLRAHGSALAADWAGSAVLNYEVDGWRVRYLHAALAGAHAQPAEVTHHGGHGKSGSRHHGAAGADSKARKGHHTHPHKKP